MSVQSAKIVSNRKALAYRTSVSLRKAQAISGLKKIIRLSSNENPYGPSKHVLEKLTYGQELMNRYPDDSYELLKESLGAHLNVTSEQIMLGNGSSEVIQFIINAFANASNQVIVSQYAFSLYKILSQKAGAEVIAIQDKNWLNDLDAFSKNINDKTSLIFIANPNNPTGTWLAEDTLVNFIKCVPEHIMVVIDEAYFEYMQDKRFNSMLGQLNNFKNLIILRTFSKAYGLAGLRVGYCVAHEEVIQKLKSYRNPFNVSAVAAECAVVALSDQEYVKCIAIENEKALNKLKLFLSRLYIDFIDSSTNFICINLGDRADEIHDQLLEQGIITRTLHEYEMYDYLRVSIGLPSEMDRLQSVFLNILYKNNKVVNL